MATGPKTPAPQPPEEWERSLRGFRADMDAMCELVQNAAADLHAPIQGGDGQTLLREALLVADHNAYHLGQLVLVLKLLGAWNPA